MNIRDVARPRVWFEDVPDHVRPALENLAGGYEEWGTSDDPFDPHDWDLIVRFGGDATWRNHIGLNVLAFGANQATVLRAADMFGGTTRALTYSTSTHSRAVKMGNGPSVSQNGWKTLLRRTVADELPNGEKRYWTYADVSDPAPEHLVIVGEALASGGAAILVARAPGRNMGELLLLPAETSDPASWLVAFLERLRDRNPARFPALPDWKRKPEWATTSLKRALKAQQVAFAQKEAAIAEHDTRIAEASRIVEKAVADAASGEQRLLTENGELLEIAVSSALRLLGYSVRNMDAEKKAGEPLLEDLRLTDEVRPGWEAIVEVKGYSRGAKASDVGQIIGRPTTAYATEKGRAPSQVLLIVNANTGTDPSQRPEALGSDPSAIDLLGLNEGALIDTRDLFRSIRAIDSGEIEAKTIRDSINAARGRWIFDAENLSQEP